MTTRSISIGATRMACSDAADEIESRFLRRLENATRFGFAAGQLVLTTNLDDEEKTMLFSAAP